MAGEATQQQRQAALLLHGLPNPARHEALARLKPEESALLEPLLSELSELNLSLLRELSQLDERLLRSADVSASLRQYLYEKYVYRPNAVEGPTPLRFAVAGGVQP